MGPISKVDGLSDKDDLFIEKDNRLFHFNRWLFPEDAQYEGECTRKALPCDFNPNYFTGGFLA